MKALVQERLQQARAALDECRALREADMDAPLVQSALYQAFYYPVIALVWEGRVPDTMQSVTIGLFEQQFVRTGRIAPELGAAVRKAFGLKPACSGQCAAAAAGELDQLMAAAGTFIETAGQLLDA